MNKKLIVIIIIALIVIVAISSSVLLSGSGSDSSGVGSDSKIVNIRGITFNIPEGYELTSNDSGLYNAIDSYDEVSYTKDGSNITIGVYYHDTLSWDEYMENINSSAYETIGGYSGYLVDSFSHTTKEFNFGKDEFFIVVKVEPFSESMIEKIIS